MLLLCIPEELKTGCNSEMTHKESGDKEAEPADKARNGVNALKNVFFRGDMAAGSDTVPVLLLYRYLLWLPSTLPPS